MINIKIKYLSSITIIEILFEETIAILVYKQISSNSFKIKITYELFTHKWYTCITI